MLSVSNSLPVSNYSVKVVSEANGSIFNPQTNSRVRLTLPSSLGMVDMHSSYLQFKKQHQQIAVIAITWLCLMIRV